MYKKNFIVIEDCAQAHGATYKGKSVGSIGHIGTWSFCNDKIISTLGEGGMISTNNKKIYEFSKKKSNPPTLPLSSFFTILCITAEKRIV